MAGREDDGYDERRCAAARGGTGGEIPPDARGGAAPLQRREHEKDYILPLFEALGWDVENAQEVSAEENTSGGRVDYAFKVNGVARFYVEAKPLREVLDNVEWAKQAITYAYNRGVPWAVLTNFGGFQGFNAHREARQPADARFPNLTCEEFLAEFDTLWLFSKEAALDTARPLEEAARKAGKAPTRLPVEKHLYGQMREWRERLFNDIFRYNDTLSIGQVDQVIQRLFNRLIFVRTCEDRRIEGADLRAALHQWRGARRPGDLAQRVRRLFARYRQEYDSDLFEEHLLDDPHSVQIDAQRMEEIVAGLYDLPGGMASYDFSLIDADILGQVYEQYLGHVAQVAKRRAHEAQIRMDIGLAPETYEIAEKRQRRKEQGIYYTPKWVVDYIVQQTVGQFIQDHKNRPDSIHDVRILDMACGSGSFLIRAYDTLLQWHAQQSGRTVEHIFEDERRAILTGNIYGVDLDQQAVEIARLNLLLRALSRPTKLPMLDANILRGNALISGTEKELRSYFGDGWEEKRPLDWTRAFPQVMDGGGFDIIIGNPPYVRIQSLPREDADYYRHKYESAFGSFDIYVLFIERALQLLKPGGRLGFITSGKFLKAEYGKKLQQLLRREATVEEIVDLSALKVFAEATTYPLMIVLRKDVQDQNLRYVFLPPQSTEHIGTDVIDALDIRNLNGVSAPQDALTRGSWPLATADTTELAAKKWDNTVSLGEIAHIFQGMITGADKIFVLRSIGPRNGPTVRVQCQATGRHYELERALLCPVAKGTRHIERYHMKPSDLLLLFPYTRTSHGMQLLPLEQIETEYPAIWSYLLEHRETLEGRERGRFRDKVWHCFGRVQNLGAFDQEKLLIPYMVHRACACWDKEGKTCIVNVTTGGYGLAFADNSQYPFLLALINSKLAHAFLREISTAHQGGYYGCAKEYLARLPIRRIDPANAADVHLHDAIVARVERMLELQERVVPLRGTGLSEERDLLQEIERVDGEIDGLVYELYGLTKKERGLVEGE